MNIFWLETDIRESAISHCDKHVVKMCVEYAQLLSGAIRILAPTLCTDTFPYRLTHKNHPCAIWTRESLGNYHLLRDLALALGEEYTFRYGKVHKSITLVERLPNLSPTRFPFGIHYTNPPLCMPDQYRTDGVVESYRKYYKGEKAAFAKWSKRKPPYWWE